MERGSGESLSNAKCVPRCVIVAQEASDNVSEVRFAKDDNVVEALAAKRSDHSRGIRVLPRTVRRDDDFLDLQGTHSLLEGQPVDIITIANQVSSCFSVSKRLDHLVGRPGRSRMIGYVEVHDSSAMMG